MFHNINHFRDVLKDYVIQEGFKLVRDKNERTRVTAHCGSDGCPWRVHASPMMDGITFQIKTIIPEHNCISSPKNAEATSVWIAKKLKDRLRENPQMPVDGMKAELRREYGVEATWMQLYRARKKAMDEIEGSYKDSYKKLPQYAVEIRKTNPGSVVKIQYERVPENPNPHFLRIFLSYEALMAGVLKGCRPFIGLDGCHLKGPYGGVLLAAIALDGDEGIFPVAWGIVETENRDSWGFFLDNLQTCIGNEKAWTFMSDGQKGIELSIREFFPNASQRRCVRHLYNNFKQLHSGIQLRTLFWAASRAANAAEFKQVMDEVKTVRPAAHDWMMKNPLELWALHKFNPAVKVDHVTNNFTESFNSWIGDLRSKPILTLLDGLRSKMMARIRSRFDEAAAWDCRVTKTAKVKLEKISRESRNCSVLFAGGDEYEVVECQRRYVVFLGRKTCSCGAWELSGIPCKHGIACALSRRMAVEDLVDPYFSKTKYMETYERIIHPMLDESMWDWEVVGDPIEPPRLRRLPGRPRKNRRREEDEPAAATSEQRKWHSIKCKTCGRLGHNKRTCQRAPVKKRKAAASSSNSNIMPSKLQPVRRGAATVPPAIRPQAASAEATTTQTHPLETTSPPQPSQSSRI